MKYAIVEFLSERDKTVALKGYTYINKVGAKLYDTVLVPTKYGLTIATVTEVTDNLPKVAAYNSYGEMNVVKEIAEVLKSKVLEEELKERKRKDIEKQLEKKIKEMDKVERFKIYAKQSAEFDDLLKEYEAL